MLASYCSRRQPLARSGDLSSNILNALPTCLPPTCNYVRPVPNNFEAAQYTRNAHRCAPSATTLQQHASVEEQTEQQFGQLHSMQVCVQGITLQPSPLAQKARQLAGAPDNNMSTKALHFRQPMVPNASQTSKQTVLIAVDPDTKGAIAVLSWPAVSSSSLVDLSTASVQVFDMPTAVVTLNKKNKRTNKAVQRRWLDVHAATRLVQQCISNNCHNELSLLAFVESPPILPQDSPFSRATCSYSVGMWHGILTALGFKASTVPVRQWKRDLQLIGQDKEYSRQLALQLFAHKVDILSRKKDHGRAEALLIAAWAAGITVCDGKVQTGPVKACVSTDGYGNMLEYLDADGGEVLEAAGRKQKAPKEIKPKKARATEVKIDSEGTTVTADSISPAKKTRRKKPAQVNGDDDLVSQLDVSSHTTDPSVLHQGNTTHITDWATEVAVPGPKLKRQRQKHAAVPE